MESVLGRLYRLSTDWTEGGDRRVLRPLVQPWRTLQWWSGKEGKREFPFFQGRAWLDCRSLLIVSVLSRSVAAQLVICVLCVTVFVVLYLLLSPPSVFIVVFDC